MNYNNYLVYDFETGSKNPLKAQPVQLAAIAVNGRTLEIFPDGEFESLIRPILDDEAAIAAGLEPLQDDALKVNGKTREELAEAPELKIVWANFGTFVGKFNTKKGMFNAPIATGYNINNFDSIIVDRLCREYGPWNKDIETQSLFHPISSVDLMTDVYKWTENNSDNRFISLDSVRDWLSIDKTNAHDALKDVKDCVWLLQRFLRMYRHFAPKIKFEGAYTR